MRLLTLLSFIAALQLATLSTVSKPEEIPGFFLKIQRNVPRLGRRSDPSLFSIPPNKRFTYYVSLFTMFKSQNFNFITFQGEEGFSPWFRDIIKPTNIMKRRLRPATSDAFEYNMIQPIDSVTLIELLQHNALSPPSVKFVHWRDFDLALQRDSELYSKLISLGKFPDLELKENLKFNKFKGNGNLGLYQEIDNDLYEN